MVKRVVWTENALREKVEILKYWKKRNKSDSYSKKLNGLFNNAVRTIQKHPALGRPTEDPEVNNMLVRDYLVYFMETDTSIIIVHLWDARRDPDRRKYKPNK